MIHSCIIICNRCLVGVKVATSAAEAIEELEKSKPEVLVSDLGMPDEEGYDLIRILVFFRVDF